MPFFDGGIHFGSAFKEKLDLATGMGNMDNGQWTMRSSHKQILEDLAVDPH